MCFTHILQLGMSCAVLLRVRVAPRRCLHLKFGVYVAVAGGLAFEMEHHVLPKLLALWHLQIVDSGLDQESCFFRDEDGEHVEGGYYFDELYEGPFGGFITLFTTGFYPVGSERRKVCFCEKACKIRGQAPQSGGVPFARAAADGRALSSIRNT